jgi:hypothetical protein
VHQRDRRNGGEHDQASEGFFAHSPHGPGVADVDFLGDRREETGARARNSSMLVRHSYLQLEIPDTFVEEPAEGGVLFHFVDPDSDYCELTVTIAARAASPAFSPRQVLVDVMKIYVDNALRSGGQIQGEPVWTDDGRVVSVSYSVFTAATSMLAHCRIATTHAALPPPPELSSTALIHPIVRLAVFASAEESEARGLAALIANAHIAPHTGAYAAALNGTEPRDGIAQMYPYVITGAYVQQRDGALASRGRAPEGAAGLTRLAPDLYLAIAQDQGEGLRVLFPSDVARDGLDWGECVAQARRNLLPKVGTAELPIALHDVPTPPLLVSTLAPWRDMHLRMEDVPVQQVLVVGESWLAAGCLVSPELRSGAQQQLGSDRIMALAPHRDRLFVFADRGDAANAQLVEAIVSIERDAPKPLSPTLFRLGPSGPQAVA